MKRDIFDKPYTLGQIVIGAVKGLVIVMLLIAIVTTACFYLALELAPEIK
jgi:hypothetical protein